MDKNGLTDWDRKNLKCLKEHGMTYSEWRASHTMVKKDDQAYMDRVMRSIGPEKRPVDDDG